MKMAKIFAVVLVVLAFAITAASAAQTTQTKYFGGIPDFSSDLTFNKINLGPNCTLNWIKVTLDLNVNGGQYVLDNDADSAGSGNFNFGGSAYIFSSSVPMVNMSFLPVVGTVQAGHSQTFYLDANVGDGLGDYSPLSPDGLVYVGGPETDSDSGYINSAVFGSYIGSGTFNVTISANQWANYSGASGIEAGITPVNADGSLEIVYDYTCVPEPGTLVAMISGMGILGFLRRRK